MENLKEVRRVADKYGKRVILDLPRFCRERLLHKDPRRRLRRQDYKGNRPRDVLIRRRQ